MISHLLILAFLLIELGLSSGNAHALPACPGQRFYLKTGEALDIQFNRRAGCDVRFMTVERGSVERRLFYSSGKNDFRVLTAGQHDVPDAWSELPRNAYLRANTETVVRFLAGVPQERQSQPSAPPVKAVPMEFCAGQSMSMQPGNTVSFRFGVRCAQPVRYTELNGQVEERVIYPSGASENRVLGRGQPWRYRETPAEIRWKALTAVTARFMVQSPLAVQQQAKRPSPKPAVRFSTPRPGLQPQRRTQTFVPTNQPSGGTTMGFLSSLWSFIFTLFWLGLIGGIIYAIVKAFKAIPAENFSHWNMLIENLQGSSLDFYQSLERSITSRQVPQFAASRIDWPEGGIFSARREYLRIKRKDLIFDICAAPFGNSFFVSWWLGPKPGFLGFIYSLPIFGPLSYFLIRPFTYYRIDTALMFQQAVHNAVLEVVDGMTQAKGLRALTESERKPVMKSFLRG